MEHTTFGPENKTNGSTHHTTEKDKGIFIFFLFIFFLTDAVGLIGNGLVIFLAGFRMKLTVNSIWFLNLAIADFIFVLSSTLRLFFILIKKDNAFTDDLLFIAISVNSSASICFLVVISLDRCLCTWLPVWAQNKRTVLRARIICIIVWVSSILFMLPLFDIFNFSAIFCVTYEFILVFLIPFLIIVSSYIAIGVRIKQLKTKKKLKSYRLIITVILAFFICHFPQNVCYFYMVITENNNWTVTDQIRMLYVFTVYLVYLKSALNPILYVFMCDDYKKKLKGSLQLVLEATFAEDHLDLGAMRQT